LNKGYVKNNLPFRHYFSGQSIPRDHPFNDPADMSRADRYPKGPILDLSAANAGRAPLCIARKASLLHASLPTRAYPTTT